MFTTFNNRLNKKIVYLSQSDIGRKRMIERFDRFSALIFEVSKHWHKITSDELAKYGLKGTYATIPRESQPLPLHRYAAVTRLTSQEPLPLWRIRV